MKNLRLIFAVILCSALSVNVFGAKKPQVAPSYAWQLLPPLGVHEPADIDTALYNYGQRSVPSAQSIAYASTGNLGASGETILIASQRVISFSVTPCVHGFPCKATIGSTTLASQ